MQPNKPPIMQQQMQQKIQLIMQSLIESFVRFPTSPLLLQFAQTYVGPDESCRISLIYSENEHFITSFNEDAARDSDSTDAHDVLHQISNALPRFLLDQINDQPDNLDNYLPPLKPVNLNHGLIHLAINECSDSLHIQVSDNLYYITFTYSGQY